MTTTRYRPVTMWVGKTKGRWELRFRCGGRDFYVGSYSSRQQAATSGAGMIERGEARELFINPRRAS